MHDAFVVMTIASVISFCAHVPKIIDSAEAAIKFQHKESARDALFYFTFGAFMWFVGPCQFIWRLIKIAELDVVIKPKQKELGGDGALRVVDVNEPKIKR